MPSVGSSRSTENKRIRQEALREWLSKKCTAQHLVDNLNKIEQLDSEDPNFKNKLDKYKVANEQRFKILDKYLPTEKYTEIEANVVATEKDRSELEARLQAAGINPDEL